MDIKYDSSWDSGNEELFDTMYAIWEERDWHEWLSDNLSFPFIAERFEDMESNPFSDYGKGMPFQVGNSMQALEIVSEDDHYGVLVKVREGRKTGHVPLAELEVTPKSDKNYWSVREYVVWFANR